MVLCIPGITSSSLRRQTLGQVAAKVSPSRSYYKVIAQNRMCGSTPSTKTNINATKPSRYNNINNINKSKNANNIQLIPLEANTARTTLKPSHLEANHLSSLKTPKMYKFLIKITIQGHDVQLTPPRAGRRNTSWDHLHPGSKRILMTLDHNTEARPNMISYEHKVKTHITPIYTQAVQSLLANTYIYRLSMPFNKQHVTDYIHENHAHDACTLPLPQSTNSLKYKSHDSDACTFQQSTNSAKYKYHALDACTMQVQQSTNSSKYKYHALDACTVPPQQSKNSSKYKYHALNACTTPTQQSTYSTKYEYHIAETCTKRLWQSKKPVNSIEYEHLTLEVYTPLSTKNTEYNYYDYEASTLQPNTNYLVSNSNTNITSTAQLYPNPCLLYTSPSPRDRQKSRMPSSA